MTRADHTHDGCGADCSYRSLYEGSQASLSDMAAKQAVALRRLGRFRTEAIRLMKRTWPTAFAKIEQRAGSRISDLDDEVVLAYLDALVRTPPEVVAQLRNALTRAGLTLPAGDDLADWVAWLRDHEPVAPAPAATPDVRGTLLNLFPAVPPDEAGAPQPASPQGDEPSQEPAPAAGGRLSGMFGPAPSPADTPPAQEPERAPEPAPLPPITDEPADRRDEGMSAQQDVPPPVDEPDEEPQDRPPLDNPAARGPRMRPEAPVTSRRNREKKKPRTRAQAPDPASFDVPPDSTPKPSGDLSEDTHNALLAAVAIPRPVFTSDLASVAGSSEAVATWERQMRDLGMDAPVRFVAAKDRHRSRGSLVLPHAFLRDAASEFTRSWWAGCIETYRGRRLYELAVLLHRVGEDVVGYHLEDETVLLRLNQRRGLVGVVTVVGTELDEGGATRQALVDDLERLFTERLSLVAVLSTREDLEAKLVEVVEAESRRRGWQPPMPVVEACSWQWADSSGTAAKAILGGSA